MIHVIVKSISFACIFASLTWGCTANYEVTSSRTPVSGKVSLTELNARLKDRTVHIEQLTGRIDTAAHVLVQPDVTRATTASTQTPLNVPTRSIKRISYRSGMGGFLEGTLLGTIGGALLGGTIALVLHPPPYHDGLEGLAIFFAGGLGGILGLLGGGAYGADEGKPIVFDLGPPAQWTETPAVSNGAPIAPDSSQPTARDTSSIALGPVISGPAAIQTHSTSLLDLATSRRWWGTWSGGLLGNLSEQGLYGIAYQPGVWVYTIRHFSGKQYFHTGDDYLTQELNQESEWQIMTGRTLEGEYHRVTASAGLSLVKGSILRFREPRSTHYSAVGIPLELRAMLKFSDFLGLGLSAFYHYNPRFHSSGILFAIEVGRL